ncbi:IMPACT family protein [Lutimonas sp.]|uniref:IMPACT family protein n=1 Tax=Lutimonas sp. TaxID=1872403 RepID=UPI003C772983
MRNSQDDVYLTLRKASEGEVYKEKGSKFLAYAYPLTNSDGVEDLIQVLKKAHPKARHWCYAWQTGVEKPTFRYNDDGEPNNSAGKPIYGQIQSFGLTNILIVVVRYFGGTKLGVGGLIVAYRSAARLALENAELVEKILTKELSLRFEYIHMDKVMRLIKENELQILSQKMELDCFLKISVRKSNLEKVVKLFEDLRCVQVKKIN